MSPQLLAPLLCVVALSSAASAVRAVPPLFVPSSDGGPPLFSSRHGDTRLEVRADRIRFEGPEPLDLVFEGGAIEPRGDGAPVTLTLVRGQSSTTELEAYSAVRWVGLWPGIDVVLRAEHRGFKLDFHVAIDADPDLIAYRFESGGRPVEVEVGADGALSVDTRLYEGAPDAFEDNRPVVVRRQLDPVNGRLGFDASAWSRRGPLLIDPGLAWSGRVGTGAGSTSVNDLVVAPLGRHAFVVGGTSGGLLLGASNPSHGVDLPSNSDAFVARLDLATLQVDKVVVFGGTRDNVPNFGCVTRDIDGTCLEFGQSPDGLGGYDEAAAVTVDLTGRVWVVGTTHATDFPLVRGLQNRLGHSVQSSESLDGFVAVFDFELGPPLAASWLGTPASDELVDVAANPDFERAALALSGSAGVVVIGHTRRTSLADDARFDGGALWPDTVAPGNGSWPRGLLLHLDYDDAGLVLHRGALLPVATGGPVVPAEVLVEATAGGGARARVVGATVGALAAATPANLPFDAGSENAFLVEVSVKRDGTWELIEVLGLSGMRMDSGGSLASDGWVALTTSSPDLAQSCAANSGQCGTSGTCVDADGFLERDVALLQVKNGQCLRRIFLGAASASATGLTRMPDGVLGVIGSTRSASFPLRAAFDRSFAGPGDGFVTLVNPNGAIELSTFLGGSGVDAVGRAPDLPLGVEYIRDADHLLVVGRTFSPDFPVADLTRGAGQAPGWSGVPMGAGAHQGFMTAVSTRVADLETTVTSAVTNLRPDETFDVQLGVANRGRVTAEKVRLIVTLEASSGEVAVRLVAPLPSGCAELDESSALCEVGALASGESKTLTFRARALVASPPPVEGWTFAVRGSALSTTDDPNPLNNTAAKTLTVGAVELGGSVHANPEPAPLGGLVDTNFTICNNGATAYDSVTPSVHPPIELTLSRGIVAVLPDGCVSEPPPPADPNVPGASFDVVRCNRSIGPQQCAVLPLSFQLDPDRQDPPPASFRVSASVGRRTVPLLRLDSARPAGPWVDIELGRARLSLAPASSRVGVKRGEVATIDLTLSNPSAAEASPPTSRASAHQLRCTLPPGFALAPTPGCALDTTTQPGWPIACALGTYAPGAVANATLRIQTPNTETTAELRCALSSPPGQRNASTATSGAYTIEVGGVDLSGSLSDSPDPVAENGTLSYLLTMANAGPDDATEVRALCSFSHAVSEVAGCTQTSETDTVCGPIAQLPALGPDAPPELVSFSVRAPSSPTTLTATCTLFSAQVERRPANNDLRASTLVGGVDLVVAEAAWHEAELGVARTHRLDFALENVSPNAAPQVQLTISLGVPASDLLAGVNLLGAEAGDTCSTVPHPTGGPAELRCTLSTIAAQTRRNLGVELRHKQVGDHTTVITAFSQKPDANPGDNVRSVAARFRAHDHVIAADFVASSDPTDASRVFRDGTAHLVARVRNESPGNAENPRVRFVFDTSRWDWTRNIIQYPLSAGCFGDAPLAPPNTVICPLPDGLSREDGEKSLGLIMVPRRRLAGPITAIVESSSGIGQDEQPGNDIATPRVNVIGADLNLTLTRVTDPVKKDEPVRVTAVVWNTFGSAISAADTVLEVRTMRPELRISSIPELGGITCPVQTDRLWRCDASGIDPGPFGDSRTFEVFVVPTADDGEHTLWARVARDSDPSDDPTPDDATARIHMETEGPDLGLQITTANGTLVTAVDDGFELVITAYNKTNSPTAEEVFVEVPVPQGLQIANLPGSCAAQGAGFRCAVGTLAPGASTELRPRVSLTDEVALTRRLAPRVTHSRADKFPADDSASLDLTWEGHKLTVSVTPTGTELARDRQETLTLRVDNPGRVVARRVDAILQPSLTNPDDSILPPGCILLYPGHRIECRVPQTDLAPGESASFVIGLRFPDAGPSSYGIGVASSTPAHDANSLSRRGTFDILGADLSVRLQVERANQPTSSLTLGEEARLDIRAFNTGYAASKAGWIIIESLDGGLALHADGTSPCANDSIIKVSCLLGPSLDVNGQYLEDIGVEAIQSGPQTLTAKIGEGTFAAPIREPDLNPTDNLTDLIVSVDQPVIDLSVIGNDPPDIGLDRVNDLTFEVCNRGPGVLRNAFVDLRANPRVSLYTVSMVPNAALPGAGCSVSSPARAWCDLGGNLPENVCARAVASSLGRDVGPWTMDIEAGRKNGSPPLRTIQAGGTVRGADLALALVGPSSANVGEIIDVTATVSNLGPSTAQSLTITFVIPTTQFIFDSSGASCQPRGSSVTCVGPALLESPDLAPNAHSHMTTIRLRALEAGRPVISASVRAASPIDDGATPHDAQLAVDILDPDSDGDGIPDSVESVEGGDGNGDGIPDRQQPHVVTVKSSSGIPVTLSGPSGTSLTNVTATRPPTPPPGLSAPVDAYGFRTQGAPGFTYPLTISYGAGVPHWSLWKYGKTAANPAAHWYDFAWNGATGAQLTSPTTLLATFVDGQRGDDDLAVNGTIVDPAAPILGLVVVETVLDTAPQVGAPRACTTGAGCSLREALEYANSSTVPHHVIFALPAGRPRIILSSPLPRIAGPVIIDGLSALGDPSSSFDPHLGPTAPIELDASALAPSEAALTIGPVRAVVMGLNVYGSPGDGIRVESGASARISRCIIGIDVAGFPTASLGIQGRGLVVDDARVSVVENLFGATAGAALLMRGDLGASRVENNLFGRVLRPGAGLSLSHADDAIRLENATHATVRDNLVVAARFAGVRVQGGGTGVVIAGNRLGVDPRGLCHAQSADDVPLIPNNDWCQPGNGTGILIDGASGVRVGLDPLRPSARDRNVIADSTWGIHLTAASERSSVIGNWLGLDTNGRCPRHPLTDDCRLGLSASAILVEGRDHVIGHPDHPNVIGEAGESAFGTVFSGHNGIQVRGIAATGNHVHGNWVGLDVTGLDALRSDGIAILDGASDNRVEANVVGVIGIADSDDNTVVANTIGLRPDGAAPGRIQFEGSGYNWSAGLLVVGSSEDNHIEANTIGGTAAEPGVWLFDGPSGTRLLDNRIGLAPDDTARPVGAEGILLGRSDGAGAAPTGTRIEGNLLGHCGGGSAKAAIRLTSNATNTRLEGNQIGLSADGAPLSNRGPGLHIDLATGTLVLDNELGHHPRGVQVGPASNDTRLEGNWIGVSRLGIAAPNDVGVETNGPATLVGNHIAHNASHGVTSASGAFAILHGNHQYANGGLAFDRDGDGLVDPFALDLPRLDSATSEGTSTRVTGHYFGADPNLRLDVFLVLPADADPSGHGETSLPLGHATIAGPGPFSVLVPGLAPPGALVTATLSGAMTSEHARNIPVGITDWAELSLTAYTEDPHPPVGAPSNLWLEVFHRAGPATAPASAVIIDLAPSLSVVSAPATCTELGATRWRCLTPALAPFSLFVPDDPLVVVGDTLGLFPIQLSLEREAGAPVDPIPANDTATVTLAVGGADLGVAVLPLGFAAIHQPFELGVWVSSTASSDTIATLAWGLATGWEPGTLPAGCAYDAPSHVVSCTVTTRFGVDATLSFFPVPRISGPANNTFRVSSTRPDPNPDNDTRTLGSIIGEGLINVAALATPAELPASGGTVTAGARDRGGKSVETRLELSAPGLTVTAATPTAGQCVIQGSSAVCELGVLPLGGADVALGLAPGAASSGALTVCAIATGDLDPSDDCRTVAISFGRADLALSLAFDPDPLTGDTTAAVLSLVNFGPSSADATVVIDPPVGAAFTGVSTDDPLATCALINGAYRCAFDAFPAGGVAIITTGLRLNTNEAGLVFAARASHPGFDPSPGNDAVSRAVARTGESRANAALAAAARATTRGSTGHARFIVTRTAGSRSRVPLRVALDSPPGAAVLTHASTSCGTCAPEAPSGVWRCELDLDPSCPQTEVALVVSALDPTLDAIRVDGHLLPSFQNEHSSDDLANATIELVDPSALADLCAPGERPRLLFADGAEGGNLDWDRSPPWSSWQVRNDVAHSGTFSWHSPVGDELDSAIAPREPIAIPSGLGRVVLALRHRHELGEARLHGARVEWSTDGSTWTADPMAYASTVTTFASMNPLAGSPAFTGRSAGWPDFTGTTLSLPTTAGPLWLRLRLGLQEPSPTLDGWTFDDLRVVGCEPRDVDLAVALDPTPSLEGTRLTLTVTSSWTTPPAAPTVVRWPPVLELLERPGGCSAALRDDDGLMSSACLGTAPSGEVLTFTLRAATPAIGEISANLDDLTRTHPFAVEPRPSLSLGLSGTVPTLRVGRAATLALMVSGSAPDLPTRLTAPPLPAHLELSSVALTRGAITTPLPTSDCALDPTGLRCDLLGPATLSVEVTPRAAGSSTWSVAAEAPIDEPIAFASLALDLSATVPSADASITLDTPEIVTPGVPFAVTVTANNAGPDVTSATLMLHLGGLSLAEGPPAHHACRFDARTLRCPLLELAHASALSLPISLVAPTGGRFALVALLAASDDPDPDNDVALRLIDAGDPCANVDCEDGDPCTTHTCELGLCIASFNDTPCDDGDACTTGDRCVLGRCLGAVLACDDGLACTVDTCRHGSCRHDPNDGAACDDGVSCTVGDVCVEAACVAGPALPCDDGDPCTAERCDTGTCESTPSPGLACDDGDACTTGDACGADGRCQGGPIACDDGNPCTSDACVDGACVFTPRTGIACDDANACTSGDTCQQGVCLGAAVTCTSDDPCAIPSCDPATGCGTTPRVHPECGACAPSPSRSECLDDRDRSRASAVDACGGEADTVAHCDDQDPCTSDRCEVFGTYAVCVHAPLDAPGCGPCGESPTPEDFDPSAWTLGCESERLVWFDPCGRIVGLASPCLDGDVCTVDGCDAELAACVTQPTDAERRGWGCAPLPSAACEPIWRCEGLTLVVEHPCIATTTPALECDDDDPTTTDGCDAAGRRCVNRPEPSAQGFPRFEPGPEPAEPGPEATEADTSDGQVSEVVELDSSDAVADGETSVGSAANDSGCGCQGGLDSGGAPILLALLDLLRRVRRRHSRFE